MDGRKGSNSNGPRTQAVASHPHSPARRGQPRGCAPRVPAAALAGTLGTALLLLLNQAGSRHGSLMRPNPRKNQLPRRVGVGFNL